MFDAQASSIKSSSSDGGGWGRRGRQQQQQQPQQQQGGGVDEFGIAAGERAPSSPKQQQMQQMQMQGEGEDPPIPFGQMPQRVVVADIPRGAGEEVQWLCTIRTANVHGADTRARVHLSIFGETSIRLDVPITAEGDELTPGSEARLTFWSAMLGPLTKIRLRHDDSGNDPGWKPESVLLERFAAAGPVAVGGVPAQPPKVVEAYVCELSAWLDASNGDMSTVREAPAVPINGTPPSTTREHPPQSAVYRVAVKTGKAQHGESHQRSRGGTDALVTILIEGEHGDTGPRQLLKSTEHADTFEEGNTDIFEVDAVGLGRIKKVRLWHSNRNSLKKQLADDTAAWLVDEVVVHDPTLPEDIVFPCNKWFDREHGFSHDLARKEVQAAVETKAVAVATKMARYQISTLTNSTPESGTVARIFLRLHGANGKQSKKLALDESISSDVMFEPGQRDTFVFRIKDTLGKAGPKSVSVWHESRSEGDDWKVDSIMVKDLTYKRLHRFTFGVDGMVFGPPPNMFTQARTSVVNLASAATSKSDAPPLAGRYASGSVTETGLWMRTIKGDKKRIPDHDESIPAGTEIPAMTVDGDPRHKTWLLRTQKQARAKKRIAEEIVKKELEDKEERRKASLSFNKKGLKNYVKSKMKQKREEVAAAAQKKEAEEKVKVRLETARKTMQSRRGNTYDTWLEKKKAEKARAKQAKIMEHTRALEAEARRAQENQACIEAWELNARQKLRKSKRSTTRTAKAEIKEAWEIQAALTKSAYFSPIHGT